MINPDANTPDAIERASGAAALRLLLRQLSAQADDACLRSGGDPTRGDRAEMAAGVEDSIRRHLVDAGAARRGGYISALTDLLSMTADGCGPSDEWMSATSGPAPDPDTLSVDLLGAGSPLDATADIPAGSSTEYGASYVHFR